MRTIYFLIINSLLLLFCSDNNTTGEIKIMDQSVKSDLQTLENLKIFFAHQSVGKNIIAGLEDLIKESGNTNINLIESDGTGKLPEYFFAHTRAGENSNPNLKCDSFKDILTEKFVTRLDIAFLKFCYIDMTANDDLDEIFNYYKSVIDTIKLNYPKLKLIHVTIPLTTVQSGWKVPIKKIIGKEVDGYAENINRAKFNMLLKEYYKMDPIFDLSKVESTYPDGHRESFEKDGSTYYALAPIYTYDGGHLNELGRKFAAKELIKVIANSI